MMKSGPQLVARLETDNSSAPVVVESGGKQHYRIDFEVRNAPKDAYAATFELDADTYYNPVRTLRPDNDGAFRLSTSTYGDYDVKVLLRTSEGDVPLSSSVRNALEKSRDEMSAGPMVDDAIAYIAGH
ncbi:MAG: hypothetical protein FJX48_05485 [Alphaproteobacteria bacterium]|nr:hypothetical protein [Alphaproteobacteria bacterium]